MYQGILQLQFSANARKKTDNPSLQITMMY